MGIDWKMFYEIIISVVSGFLSAYLYVRIKIAELVKDKEAIIADVTELKLTTKDTSRQLVVMSNTMTEVKVHLQYIREMNNTANMNNANAATKAATIVANAAESAAAVVAKAAETAAKTISEAKNN